jgi:hypothetical protein
MLNTKINTNLLTEISLAKHKVWKIDGDRRGDSINCMNGRLWITQEGDLKDYVVEAGQNFWVTKPGSIVIQALDNAQFKYSLTELESHVEINPQPVHHPHRPRLNTHMR